jgi:hypothetical protein
MKYNSIKRKNNFVTSFFCISLFIINYDLIAQNAEFNHKKYWYLKWRLKNYFMVEGEGYGKILPMGIRNTNLFNPIFLLYH